MSRLGAKQAIGINVSIATTETLLGYVTGLIGAIGILVRFSGGSNSTNGLVGIRAQSIDGAGSATTSKGGQTWVADPDPASSSVALLTSPVPPDGSFIYLVTDSLSLVAMPKAALYGTMGTALSNGVEIDAWPVYPDAGSVHSSLTALP